MNFVWIYDHLLTLGDEARYSCVFRPRYQVLTVAQIKYGWSGRKSWGEFIPPRPKYNRSYGCLIVFALFVGVWRLEMPQTVPDLTVLQNRYLPIMFFIWINFFTFGHSVSPYPGCHGDAILTRPPVVVRSNSPSHISSSSSILTSMLR